mgnify:CR=1 FL=1
MKKLPVNEKPFIRTYTYHAFLQSIISSSDKINEDISKPVAQVTIKDLSTHRWRVENSKTRYDMDAEGNLKVYANKWNLGMELAFWRECQENDQIEITIHHQLYSNSRSSINLFLTNSDQEDIHNIELYNIRFGCSPRRGVNSSVLRTVKMDEYLFPNPVGPLNLRLIKEDKNIYIEYRDSEMHSGKKLLTELEDSNEYARIGFAVNLGDSSYYEWMFSNYIQIYSNTDLPIPIDFFWNSPKNWHYYTTNYFMDYQLIPEEEVLGNGWSTIQFIERQIDLNRYVEVLVNDNMHIKGADVNSPYFHQDLIYGYDHESEILYFLYYRNGKPLAAEMSYSDFLSPCNALPDRIFYLMQYIPSMDKYRLSQSHILQLFKEYRDGQNISYYVPELENGYHIGLDCIRYFSTEEGLEKILADIRISFLLCEHSECNRLRVQYLEAKGILSEYQRDELLKLLDTECENLGIIRNLAIKVLVGGTPTGNDSAERMKKVYESDKEFTALMIRFLEEN